MKNVLKTLFAFLLFIVIFLGGGNRLIYGQACNDLSIDIIDRGVCELADPTQYCQVEPFRQDIPCWRENGKCVSFYYWSGCYDQYINNRLQCVFHESLMKIDCESPEGGTGTGPSYIYNRCPSGQSLSCGSSTEAEAQNKTSCLYRETCNKYFWPSSIRTPAPCNSNPVSATCNSNCSCCPSGSSRTCTQGSQYTKNITIDMAWDTAQREALKVTCNTHDDIFISNVKTRDYWWGDEDHYQDWRLTCRTNTCGCVAPTATPTPTSTPSPTPWIRVNVKNSAGTAVNSSQICGVDCSGSVCVKKTGIYCSVNDNSFTFPKFTATNTYIGGRIALTDNLAQPLTVLGVTPSVVGFVETTCNNIGGYCYVWNKNSWTTGGRTVDFVVAIPTNTPTITPTSTPVPPAPGKWVKLKDTSFVSSNSLLNTVPAIPVRYDSDDTIDPYFIIRDGGIVAAPNVDLGTGAGVKANTNNTYVESYTPKVKMSATNFISYIKARKAYKEVSNVSDINNISESGLYLYTGPSPLTFNSIPPSFDLYNIVLVSATTVDININLDGVIDPNLKSIAIVANMIRFGATVTQADGIFIGNTVRTGTADFGFKINGNLIAGTTFVNSRTQGNPNVPSVFVVFKGQKYLDLLPYLSTANYEWRQIQ